jgi:peptidyl-prolyl cis-trans isomerase C
MSHPRLLVVVKSPLLHFVVLGCAIFALAPTREDTRRVDLSSSALASVEQAQAARDGVTALTPERAHEVDARAIEDEVLYREALRLGLDKDDPIVRQRLIQKLLLLVEDMSGASRTPTEAELRAWFDADPARFKAPARVHFVHVFASKREALPTVAALPTEGIPAIGDPFPYPRDARGSREEIARTYGDGFAAATFARVPTTGWSDPIASSFGWHRVRVVDTEGARVPPFEEVRGSIALDYALDKRTSAVGAYLKKTTGDYTISIDRKPLVGFTPTHRVALRSDPSAED